VAGAAADPPAGGGPTRSAPARRAAPALAAALVFAATPAVFVHDPGRAAPRTAVPVRALFEEGHELSRGDRVWKAITRADSIFAAWLVSRNAYTFVHRPRYLFDTEHCAPAERTMTLGEPMLTMGLLAVPAYLATGDPILTYNIVLCLQWVIGALAMYALVVAWTGQPAAGIVAGLLYTLHPVHARDITHPFIYDMAWTVLALLFAQRLFAHGRWRDAVGLGLAIALQIGSSLYPLLGAFFLVPPFVLWLVVRYRFRQVRAGQLALAAGLAAAAAAAVFGPYLAARESTDALRRGYHYYAEWASFLPRGGRFPGWPAVGLVIAGLTLGRRRALPRLDGGDPRWALLLGGVVVGVTSMGGHGASVLSALRGDPALPIRLPNLYTLTAAVVPGLDMVRNAAQLANDVHLVACILTGLGAAALLRLVGPRAARALAAALILAVTLDTLRPPALGLTGGIRWDVVPIRPQADVIEFYETLARQGNDGPVVEVPISSSTVYTLGGALQQILVSAWHHRRTSACFGSYKPPERAAVAALSQQLPGAAAVRELARLGFTTIVVHQLPVGPLRLQLDAAARERPDLLRLVHATPRRSAYAIVTGAGDGWAPAG
jgi:hypothetical protein